MNQDLLSVNPITKVVRPKVHDKLPRLVRPEDLECICGVLKADYERKVNTFNGVHEHDLIWTIPLFWFALYSGMRIGELARLRWEHIDFEKRLIYILKQKNRKQHTIPLNIKVADILSDVDTGEPEAYLFRSPQTLPSQRKVTSFTSIFGRIFQRYLKAAGLPTGLCFH